MKSVELLKKISFKCCMHLKRQIQLLGYVHLLIQRLARHQSRHPINWTAKLCPLYLYSLQSHNQAVQSHYQAVPPGGTKKEPSVVTKNWWELVSWCFKPSQPQRITSGLITGGRNCLLMWWWCILMSMQILKQCNYANIIFLLDCQERPGKIKWTTKM